MPCNATKSRLSGTDKNKRRPWCKHLLFSFPPYIIGPRDLFSRFKFFATPRTAQSDRGPSRVKHRHRPRLQLLIPDTLVFNVKDEPQWYYTDKVGPVPLALSVLDYRVSGFWPQSAPRCTIIANLSYHTQVVQVRFSTDRTAWKGCSIRFTAVHSFFVALPTP